jgi:serine/threonine-protein kinase
MGEIFLARLEGAAGFEKLYVVKRILPHLADDARFRAMLIAEARIASKLSHANICQVYELGETDGQLYIVMEYLEGITVLPLLRKASKEATALDFGFVGGVIQQTTDALHYAHELRDRGGESYGIVHRDVTPSNIFLTEAGVVKVLDFGIAKVKDASTHTQTGAVKGKYAYMAPEQLRGVSVDRRADVFALGVVVYEMLALRRLFQRKTDYLTFRAVMEQPVPDVRRYRPDVPEALAISLARALDRDPDHRFESARQLAGAIIDALAVVKRVWTQGEIADYVRANFADEVGKQSEQVESALQRTQATGQPAMPEFAPESPGDDDDDDEFPAVDSIGAEAPTVYQQEYQSQTPPPFASTTANEHRAANPNTIIVQRRSLVWPLLAIAMVGIAGGALFLVWKQMQQQQPAVVNITSEPAPREPAVTPPAPVPPVPAVASGSAKPVPQVVKPVKPSPPRRSSPYDDAIQLHRTRIAQCAKDHGVPPANARVVIDLTTAGKVKSITLEPTDLNSSPLGGCIKTVLSRAKYPTAAAEMRVSVPLKAS